MTHPYYPSGNPRFNHVAMSVPADLLDEAHRADICGFFDEVFGFTEMPTMTIDRQRLILSCVHWDQFVFLIADDDPMACPRLDHFGLAVGERSELGGHRGPGQGLCRARRPGRPDRDQGRRPGPDQDPLALRPVPSADDVRDPVLGVRLVSAGARQRREPALRGVRPPGLEARVHRVGGGRGLGPVGGVRPTGRIARLRPPVGLRPCRDGAPTRAHPHVRGLHHALGPLPADQHGGARPAGDLRQLPQCRPAGQGGGLPRRLLGGRAILGLGAGWYHEEYASYGYRYPPDLERLAVLDGDPRGGGQVLDARSGSPSTASTCTSPTPTASPSPCSPCRRAGWAGGGEKVTLRIAAQHADATNWQVGLEGFVRKSGLLARYCEEIGRDFADITRTHGPGLRHLRDRGRVPGLVRLAGRREPVGRPGHRQPTCGTTWSAPSNRWRRRPRASWTPAAGSSSCGCVTPRAT